jgi:hypothetical protein
MVWLIYIKFHKTAPAQCEKQQKILSLVAEFIAVPICYVISAVLFLLLALIIFLYLNPDDPEVSQQLPVVQQPIKESDLQKKLYTADSQTRPPIRESCGKPWKASPKEIKEAIIRKVEYSPQPGTGLNELHLDVETADQQNFIIHVSPEYKISRCPNLFTFEEGETVTVLGFELLGNQANICATEITRQNTKSLKLRDQKTGKYNNTVFNHEICKKELPRTIYSCGNSWKTPLMEIEGTIKKVEYRMPPWGNQKGLHFDVETTDKQSVVIHVFPEPKTSQCPDLFPFNEGDRVTVIGSEFSTPKSKENICASGIIRQDVEPLELNDQKIAILKLRDPITGNHNNSVFNNKICIDEDELKRSSFFNWMKAFLSYQESCKHCTDELVSWNNPEGILARCKDCADHIAIIPKEYSRANDCLICQEKKCSHCSDPSDPNVMPPKCWKTCMKVCGTTMGDITGYGMNIRINVIEDIKNNNPDLWRIIAKMQRRESLRAYLLFLLLIVG